MHAEPVGCSAHRGRDKDVSNRTALTARCRRRTIAASLAALCVVVPVSLAHVRAAVADTVLTCPGVSVPAVTASPPDPARPDLRDVAPTHGVSVGSEVSAAGLADNALYRDVAAAEFDVVTPGNEMKWATTEPQQGVFDFCNADTVVSFAKANGMHVRGHNLAWYIGNPLWLENGSFTRDQAIAILKDHIETEVGHFHAKFPGIVTQWDVVNEAVSDCAGPTACGLRTSESVWYRDIGPDYVQLAFQFAHEADPTALLFYNDYNMEISSAKLQGVYNLVQSLRAQGVTVDGVGFQMHTSIWGPSQGTIASALSQITALGVQVGITELDVGVGITSSTATEQPWQLYDQEAMYQAVAGACLAVSACHTLVSWGFTDAETWRRPDQPCMFDKNYQPKPAYYGMLQVLGEATPEVITAEAEKMAQKTAGQAGSVDGWNLLSNGQVADSFWFAGAPQYHLTVSAKGQYGGGAWPNLEVLVDGVAVAEVTVATSSWQSFEVPLASMSGWHTLALAFTNDYYSGTSADDRNLYLDEVAISSVVPAQSMEVKSTGAPVTGGWALYSKGYVANPAGFLHDADHRFEIVARGDYAGGAWPAAQILVDGVVEGQVTVASASWATFYVDAPVTVGRHLVAVQFSNDYDGGPGADRNLYVQQLTVGSPADPA